MSTNEVVVALQNKAAESKVFNDVAHMFASRHRTRFIITMSGLRQRMEREGFTYDLNDYSQVLKFLAGLGLGKLDTDSSGMVRALKDVKLTLQSIGQAAIGPEPILRTFKRRNSFEALPAAKSAPAKAPLAVSEPKKAKFEIEPPSLHSVVLNFNGKSIVVPVPKDLTAEEVGALVARFR